MTLQISKFCHKIRVFLFLENDLSNINSHIIVSFHLIVAKTSTYRQKDAVNSMKLKLT